MASNPSYPSRPPVWTILAPLPLKQLRAVAARIEGAEVLRGAGNHNALVCALAGSEGLDQDLAGELSALHPEVEIAMLRFRDEAEAVWIYKGGTRVREQPDSPWAVSASLGCPMRPPVEPSPTLSVCVVLDRTPFQVARALGLPDVPASGPMHIVANSRGAYFYSETGNVAILRRKVANETRARVYLLSARNAGAEFFCSISENGEELGVYEIPVFLSNTRSQVSAVEGYTDPPDICRALEVPPILLGM